MLPYDLERTHFRHDQLKEAVRTIERATAGSDPGAEPSARQRCHPLTRLGRQLTTWGDWLAAYYDKPMTD